MGEVGCHYPLLRRPPCLAGTEEGPGLCYNQGTAAVSISLPLFPRPIDSLCCWPLCPCPHPQDYLFYNQGRKKNERFRAVMAHLRYVMGTRMGGGSMGRLYGYICGPCSSSLEPVSHGKVLCTLVNIEIFFTALQE